jgi:hypothetical protein
MQHVIGSRRAKMVRVDDTDDEKRLSKVVLELLRYKCGNE